MELDQDVCYRAVKGRDRRFDGVFYTAVRTTGIYCRPSCPAITPQAAQRRPSTAPPPAPRPPATAPAGAACPTPPPGRRSGTSPPTSAARAMRLVADGVVEREGVDGLARALGYSTRQLNRVVTQQYGAGPLALARSRRAQTARVLIETTDLSFADVAFAAGFASVRQFNDTLREVYAASPTELRDRRRQATPRSAPPAPSAPASPSASRSPPTTCTTSSRCTRCAGIEAAGPGWYERAVRLPHGPASCASSSATGPAGLRRRAPSRWPTPATSRPPSSAPAACSTPTATRSPSTPRLAEDPLLGAAGRRRSRGCACPATLDGAEMAVQTVLGQQVSVAAARTAAARLVEPHGEPLGLEGAHAVDPAVPDDGDAGRPRPGVVADAPRRAGARWSASPRRWTAATCALDRSTDRAETRRALLALPGIGPWTADYVAMRALGDPDVFLPDRPRRAQRRRRGSASTTWHAAARAGGPGVPTR